MSRTVTLIVHGEDAQRARSFRVPVWVLRALLTAAALLLIGVLTGFVLLAPLARAAARVPGLEHQVRQLKTENAKVQTLARELAKAEAEYQQIRAMMGGGIVPAPPPKPLLQAPAIEVGLDRGPGLPHRWPLDEAGFLTRGQVSASGDDDPHPGIDVAVPVGTAVRASGGGTVLRAGPDPQYGNYVLLSHPGDYQSLYGHLSRIVVVPGDTVVAGQVVGLSGNSGRSTAPHLHFEIRRDGVSIDPLTMVKEAR